LLFEIRIVFRLLYAPKTSFRQINFRINLTIFPIVTTANTIDEVLTALDRIIDTSMQDNNPHGLFACLYRRVTQQVKDALGTGYFEDDLRMERLDVAFANRYLIAHEAFQQQQACSTAWQSALLAGQKRTPFLLRHLLLGINAHINLDLGLAAAQIAPGDQIVALENDFNQINELLGAMVDDTQERLNRFSPLLRWFDNLTGKSDEWLAGFSVKKARDHAWGVALQAAQAGPQKAHQQEVELDQKVTQWANHLNQPGKWISIITTVIGWWEPGNYGPVMDALRSPAIT
jgi:hypothetical protein